MSFNIKNMSEGATNLLGTGFLLLSVSFPVLGFGIFGWIGMGVALALSGIGLMLVALSEGKS